MGNTINPVTFRLGINRFWYCHWCFIKEKNYTYLVLFDLILINFLFIFFETNKLIKSFLFNLVKFYIFRSPFKTFIIFELNILNPIFSHQQIEESNYTTELTKLRKNKTLVKNLNKINFLFKFKKKSLVSHNNFLIKKLFKFVLNKEINNFFFIQLNILKKNLISFFKSYFNTSKFFDKKEILFFLFRIKNFFYQQKNIKELILIFFFFKKFYFYSFKFLKISAIFFYFYELNFFLPQNLSILIFLFNFLFKKRKVNLIFNKKTNPFYPIELKYQFQFKILFLIFQFLLKVKLKILDAKNYKNYQLYFLLPTSPEILTASLVCRKLLIYLKDSKRLKVKNILGRIGYQLQQNSKILGYKFSVVGRVTKTQRSSHSMIKYGLLPLSTLSAPIDYAQKLILTRYGVACLRVWIYTISGLYLKKKKIIVEKKKCNFFFNLRNIILKKNRYLQAKPSYITNLFKKNFF